MSSHSTRHAESRNEVWKDVPGYVGYYQVSNQGGVKSLARVVPMSSGRRYRVREKLLKPAWNGRYYHVILSRDGREKTHLLHQLVLLAFAGPRPKGMEGRHLDGDSRNNRRSNLRWGTKKSNQADRVLHGTSCRGRKGNAWKLVGKVQKIVEAVSSGRITVTALAESLGVSTQAVYYHLRRAKAPSKEITTKNGA